MSDQHMHFEETTSEYSLSPSEEGDSSYYRYLSQTNRHKLRGQEKSRVFTVQHRLNFARRSLFFFMAYLLFTFITAYYVDISIGNVFTQIFLLSSIILLFVAIIGGNAFFNLFRETSLNKDTARDKPSPHQDVPSPEQRLSFAKTTLLLLIVLFSFSILIHTIMGFPGNTFFPILILVVGGSLYFLAAVLLNILFNSRPSSKR